MKIAIYSSKPQSGKSTVGEILMTEYGLTKLSFAEPVKESLLVVLKSLGVESPEDYLWGENKDEIISELDITGGYLMSTYATQFFRNTIDENVWLNCFQKRAKLYGNWFVDDLRFENEYRWLKSQGVVIIRLERPKTSLNGRFSDSEGNLSHLPFDAEIVNDSSIEILKQKVKSVIENLKV